MRIGIIGAGNIGGTLTRRLSEVGHQVEVANSRGPQTLRELEEETGARAVSADEAAREKDVVVVTVPERSVTQLPANLSHVADGTVVVDTGNYYPRQRDGRIAEIEEGTPESRWVERQIGHPVVKAFNNIYAQHLMDAGRPKGDPARIALPVAGDDEGAKQVVMELVEELGFDAVDAGGLDESWRQQPGTPVYTADLDAERLRSGLSEASRERSEEFRATAESPGSYEVPR